MQPEQQQRIMGYFIEEAKEHLNTIEQGLLNLQSTLADSEMTNELFRAAHSVKGGAAMLGLNSIQRVSHRLEDFFKVLRESPRTIAVDQKLEGLFLQVFDALQELINQLQGPFGLSEEMANATVANIEPTFVQLEQHLAALAGVSGAVAASAPTVVPSVAAPIAATPAADSALQLIFGSDVPAQLREMLQLFKQPETDSACRQQLQSICRTLISIGEQFDLPDWCHLVEMARQVIAGSDHPYRTLAPIVIRDIKQAQELVLAGRATEISPCARLLELVPLGANVAEPNLADLLATTDLPGSTDAGHERGVAIESPLLEPDTPFEFEDGASLEVALGGRLERQGPEVGMAELNTLADLFEGEVPDLGATWRPEDGASEGADAPIEYPTYIQGLDENSDFSDLLFEGTGSNSEALSGGDDDLNDLFGDALFDDPVEPTPKSTTSDLDDLFLMATPEAESVSAPHLSDRATPELLDPFAIEPLADITSPLAAASESEERELVVEPLPEARSSSTDNLGDLFANLDASELDAVLQQDSIDLFALGVDEPNAILTDAAGSLPTDAAVDFVDFVQEDRDPWESESLDLDVSTDFTLAASGNDPESPPELSRVVEDLPLETADALESDFDEVLLDDASINLADFAIHGTASGSELFGSESDLEAIEELSFEPDDLDFSGLFASTPQPQDETEELFAEELVAEELVAEELVAEELVAEELVAEALDRDDLTTDASGTASDLSDLFDTTTADDLFGVTSDQLDAESLELLDDSTLTEHSSEAVSQIPDPWSDSEPELGLASDAPELSFELEVPPAEANAADAADPFGFDQPLAPLEERSELAFDPDQDLFAEDLDRGAELAASSTDAAGMDALALEMDDFATELALDLNSLEADELFEPAPEAAVAEPIAERDELALDSSAAVSGELIDLNLDLDAEELTEFDLDFGGAEFDAPLLSESSATADELSLEDAFGFDSEIATDAIVTDGLDDIFEAAEPVGETPWEAESLDFDPLADISAWEPGVQPNDAPLAADNLAIAESSLSDALASSEFDLNDAWLVGAEAANSDDLPDQATAEPAASDFAEALLFDIEQPDAAAELDGSNFDLDALEFDGDDRAAELDLSNDQLELGDLEFEAPQVAKSASTEVSEPVLADMFSEEVSSFESFGFESVAPEPASPEAELTGDSLLDSDDDWLTFDQPIASAAENTAIAEADLFGEAIDLDLAPETDLAAELDFEGAELDAAEEVSIRLEPDFLDLPELGAEETSLTDLDLELDLLDFGAVEPEILKQSDSLRTEQITTDGLDQFGLNDLDAINLPPADSLEEIDSASATADDFDFFALQPEPEMSDTAAMLEATALTGEEFSAPSVDLDFEPGAELAGLDDLLQGSPSADSSPLNDMSLDDMEFDGFFETGAIAADSAVMGDFSEMDAALSSSISDDLFELSESPDETATDALAATDDFAGLNLLLSQPDSDDAAASDLDDVFGAGTSAGGATLGAIAANTPPSAAATDFADLEALLDDEPAAAPPPASDMPSVAPSVRDTGFDELDALLKDAEEKMGGSPAAKTSRSSVPQARRATRPGRVFSEQTMRVPVKHLDNLSNLVGELVVNRNSLEQDQERLRQSLDNLLYQVQQLSDVGQRMQDLYERSLLESSLLASRQNYRLAASGRDNDTSTQLVSSEGVEYDPLEMDRFTGFHSLSQEMIELIVRVRESASDIEFVVDETDQVTRMFRQVTTQLQEGLTRSRMVPFAQTADRLPRAVRDISMKVGKQAELQIEGRETLIDKMILEQLYDPMTHLVNNAITHGIEAPDVRRAAGKSPAGRIVIRAFHQGNQTIISVSDDGAGIDVERVKAKAIEKGLIMSAEARSMTRLDIYDLLFHAGFSTKDQADDFSGRGVGMDVVRTSLSEIRGVINTDSTPGKGTTFTIRLPLTLSISKALCCISDRARIAFPMDGVEDMLDVPKERIQQNGDGQPCIAWRDSLLPLRPLADLLGYSRYLSRGTVYGGNQEDDIVSIVVLRSAGNFLALQVDQVLGEQEIVIKQLEGPVPKPVGVAGATVLGDGRIMPIADVLELIDLSMGRIRRDVGGSLWEQGGDTIVQEAPVVKTEPMVLIVDDSITVRELLSMTFNKVGYRVEQARDGQEAWEKLRAGLPCDIVFCDIEMPRMDGLELLSRIQKDSALAQLPIAMLTSRGADRHRQMAASLGASGYFTKPYLEEALLDAAQRMLKGEKLL
jgi:chemosensory pili system protein ChpA (sensor histidine kinase/response regulator)